MTLIAGTNYKPGFKSVFFIAQETATYPYVTTPYPSYPAAAAPAVGSALLPGYCDIPAVNSDEGTKTGHGGGTQVPAYTVKGTRTHDLSCNMRPAVATVLSDLINNTAGPIAELGATDHCLWFGDGSVPGGSDPNYFERLRYAKAKEVNISGQKGVSQECQASLSFWGLYREAETTGRTLSLSSYNSMGAPFMWSDVLLSLNGVQHKDHLTAFQFRVIYNLERVGDGPELTPDSNVHSRRYNAIKCNSIDYAFTFSLDSPKLAAALVSATAWSSGVAFSLANGVSTLSIAIASASLKRRSQRAGDITSNMMGDFEAVIRNVTATAS